MAATLSSDERAAHPHAAASLHPVADDVVLGQHLDEEPLETAHVGDDIHRLGQAHDRVADELPRAVPGDLAAAVDVDDGGAVGGALVPRRARTGRVDGLVLEQDERVGADAGDDVGVDAPLEMPSRPGTGRSRGRAPE